MATIRRRGGLFVAAAAVSLALASITTITTGVLQVVESNPIKSDYAAPASLRGGQQKSLKIPGITSRNLEDGQQQAEENENANDDQQEQQQEEYAEEEEQEQEEEEQEEEEEQNDSADNMNDDGNQNGNDDSMSTQDIVDNVKDTFQGLMDRFDEDVVSMWSTSPAEWDEEFWKVFGILAVVATVLLSCLIYICCLCCCNGSSNDNNGKDFLVATQSEADAQAGNRKSYRGRRFLGRSRNGETNTVGADDSSHTGRTGNTTNDWESPFVLIEDVEKDDTYDEGSNSNHMAADITSPVYERGNDVGDFGAISPLSNKTRSTLGLHDSSDTPGAPESKTYAAPTIPTMSHDDNDTQASNGKTLKNISSVLKEPSGGIINETVEVWSEFLGFKKSKYNIPPRTQTQDEDDDINLTDDEKTRRTSRSRMSASSSKRRSSKKRSSDEIPLSRNSTNNTDVRSQMRTGTYTKPNEGSSIDNEIGGETSSAAFADENVAETPIMSNSTNNARMSKVNSPRRTALIKTKNLLKSFGNNKVKVNRKLDPKGENLLNDNEISGEA